MRNDIEFDQVLDANRRFHDEVEALDYDQRMGVRHDNKAVTGIIDELERVLGETLPKGERVVDLGAGTGNLAVKLAIDGRFSEVIAVDISAKMLAQAEQAAEAHGCRITTVVSDMTSLPFDDASMDLVVGCAMLHHVPDPQNFLKEVHRVLKPGAPVIIIGEPSHLGEWLVHVMKLPAILAVRVYRKMTGRTVQVWEHDMIDVHNFKLDDIRNITSPFARLRLHCEGFLEPLIDQGFLVLARRALRVLPGIEWCCDGIRRVMQAIDRAALNKILPQSVLVSIKFAAWK